MTARKTAKTPLRLRSGEPLAKGIRRIARAQVDAACRELQKAEGPREAIHQARTALKKLRALLQLVAEEFNPASLQREKHAFRDAARLLAPIRDADVQIQTLRALIETAGLDPEKFARLRGELEADLARLASRAGTPKSRARHILSLARGRIARWPLKDLEWENLRREIRRAYREGRKALRVYQREPDSEAFHAWRKRVKKLWYHLRITRSFLPEAVHEWIARLGEIGEIAGNAQDLAVLRGWLAARVEEPQSARLLAEIDARLPELQRAATALGVSFYAEKPREFEDRLRSCGKSGRGARERGKGTV